MQQPRKLKQRQCIRGIRPLSMKRRRSCTTEFTQEVLPVTTRPILLKCTVVNAAGFILPPTRACLAGRAGPRRWCLPGGGVRRRPGARQGACPVYCEVYRATIPEKTCVLRQKVMAAGPGKCSGLFIVDLYSQFIGCRGCAAGLALYGKYKKGVYKHVRR